MGLKVAIVGLSDTTHDLAPWDDNTWEKWGLPWDLLKWPEYHRLFEMHDLRLLESDHSKRPDDYIERLKYMNVYMQEQYFPSIKKYPFKEIEKTVGSYFNSSISYAMAMAIHEQAEEISVYGVDMKGDDEYGYQKPNMEYLVGLAIGKGIKVTIPEESLLCKFAGSGIRFYDHYPEYIDRYGWLG